MLNNLKDIKDLSDAVSNLLSKQNHNYGLPKSLKRDLQ